MEENVSLQRTLRLIRFAAPVLALAAAPALAGTTLTLQAKGTGAVLGSGMLITNTQDATAATEPFAIEGDGTGKRAGGVLGSPAISGASASQGATAAPGLAVSSS
jgi:hypothetical protein